MVLLHKCEGIIGVTDKSVNPRRHINLVLTVVQSARNLLLVKLWPVIYSLSSFSLIILLAMVTRWSGEHVYRLSYKFSTWLASYIFALNLSIDVKSLARKKNYNRMIVPCRFQGTVGSMHLNLPSRSQSHQKTSVLWCENHILQLERINSCTFVNIVTCLDMHLFRSRYCVPL